MRGFLMVLAACGSTTSTESPQRAHGSGASAPRTDRPAQPARLPIDAVSALSQPRVEAAWIVPGPAQMVLGGTSLQPVGEIPLEVDVLEERGGEVRVGVRLEHARFAVWVGRSSLLGVMSRGHRVAASSNGYSGGDTTPNVELRAGAVVHRIARENGFTQIRYVGSLEVEGWVPDDAVGDRGAAGRSVGRRTSGRKPLMVQPGATIRTDKRWAARALAVAHYSMFFEIVEVVDDGWHKVSYSDGDVGAYGFLSKREPPSRTHPSRPPEPNLPLTTNMTVPADTCLYGGDEPIGFIDGARAVLVEASPRVGWFMLTLDTPWGPVAFEASGPTETSLTTCAGAT